VARDGGSNGGGYKQGSKGRLRGGVGLAGRDERSNGEAASGCTGSIVAEVSSGRKRVRATEKRTVVKIKMHA
jgi:hypothetical protein